MPPMTDTIPPWNDNNNNGPSRTNSMTSFPQFDDNISSLSKDETTLYWGGNTAASQYTYGENVVFYRRPGFLLSAGLVFVMFVTIIISAIIVFSVPPPEHELDWEELRYSAEAAMELKKVFNDKKTHKKVKSSCEATVFIIRHCDKFGDVMDKEGSSHCNYQGFERSSYYADLFGDDRECRWPSPSYIYSYEAIRSDHYNFREYETIDPLASKIDVEVNTVYGAKDNGSLANEISDLLRKGHLCGKIALISWKHSEIGDFSRKLGCGPADGCPTHYPEKTFDRGWQLKYVLDPPRLYNSESNRDLSHHHSTKMEESSTTTKATTLSSSKTSSKRYWRVYGTVVDMNFDPLYYSKTVGDYSIGGSNSGGSWIGKGG